MRRMYLFVQGMAAPEPVLGAVGGVLRGAGRVVGAVGEAAGEVIGAVGGAVGDTVDAMVSGGDYDRGYDEYSPSQSLASAAESLQQVAQQRNSGPQITIQQIQSADAE